ncbi:EAL domain-containing protein [Pseudomonas sp. KB_15]|uniref:EAL domain-containing response regulator n=1 Tax=Pseudomonas sp. KB_15 TaxID=3233035 RepID=UPI003F9CA878
MRLLNVLVLEDNSFELMVLHKMLNAIQVFNVLTADSVEVAQQALANRGGVDIAICDLQMDGPDGLDMIRFLAKYRLARALIILSGTDQSILDGAAHFARSQGILLLGSLRKPMSPDALCQLLETYQDLVARGVQSVPLKQASQQFSLEELHQLAPGQRIGDTGTFAQWVAYYQPKVSFEGRLAGVEALVRWQHPIHGLMSPGQFLDAVDSAGLIEPLTWRMLDLALTLSSRVLRERGECLPVSVNIPPSMIERDDFARQILALLVRFGLPANVLTLEIVESPLLQAKTAHLEGLLRLRMQGCHLSIDDFGTGASNIQRLLQLPFSELKIPAEFVRGIGDDGRKSSVVAGALIMAQKMALSVVVEGVETARDYRALQALGEPTIQGYFIARPMSEVDLLCWIEERTKFGGIVRVV